MMMTGKSGWRPRMASSSARPSMPGMRMSVMMASGGARSRASSTPAALSNEVTSMSACRSAFSKTQRMERSSSMTKMRLLLFMVGL